MTTIFMILPSKRMQGSQVEVVFDVARVPDRRPESLVAALKRD